MFVYEKKLQYPIRVKNTNPRLAKIIISQYGGPDGELGASMRYLSQRFTMPYDELKGLLTDIGTYEPKVGTFIDSAADKPFFPGIFLYEFRTKERLPYRKHTGRNSNLLPPSVQGRELAVRVFIGLLSE